jgi:hypothetical protein
MLTVLEGLADIERDLIRARTGEGRARAMALGVEMGRKPKLAPHQQKEAIKRRDRGETLAEIGRSYNVTRRRFLGWRRKSTGRPLLVYGISRMAVVSISRQMKRRGRILMESASPTRDSQREQPARPFPFPKPETL